MYLKRYFRYLYLQRTCRELEENTERNLLSLKVLRAASCPHRPLSPPPPTLRSDPFPVPFPLFACARSPPPSSLQTTTPVPSRRVIRSQRTYQSNAPSGTREGKGDLTRADNLDRGLATRGDTLRRLRCLRQHGRSCHRESHGGLGARSLDEMGGCCWMNQGGPACSARKEHPQAGSGRELDDAGCNYH